MSDLTTICEESGIPIEIDRDDFGEVWVKRLRLRRPGTDDSEPVLEEKFPRLKEFFNLRIKAIKDNSPRIL